MKQYLPHVPILIENPNSDFSSESMVGLLIPMNNLHFTRITFNTIFSIYLYKVRNIIENENNFWH